MRNETTPDDFADLDFAMFHVEGGTPKVRQPWNGEEAFNHLAAEVQAKRDAKVAEKVARALDISPLLEADETSPEGFAHLYVAANLGGGKRGWFRVTDKPLHRSFLDVKVKDQWAKSPGIRMAIATRMPKWVAA